MKFYNLILSAIVMAFNFSAEARRCGYVANPSTPQHAQDIINNVFTVHYWSAQAQSGSRFSIRIVDGRLLYSQVRKAAFIPKIVVRRSSFLGLPVRKVVIRRLPGPAVTNVVFDPQDGQSRIAMMDVRGVTTFVLEHENKDGQCETVALRSPPEIGEQLLVSRLIRTNTVQDANDLNMARLAQRTGTLES